jgi:Na+-transporting NADH:ubiquinone oxidoreductase subunit NqrC
VRGGTGEFEVDGISGATRSSSGVGNLVRFWLGENGFGPFLARLRQGEAE